jgi:hypothetical protein
MDIPEPDTEVVSQQIERRIWGYTAKQRQIRALEDFKDLRSSILIMATYGPILEREAWRDILDRLERIGSQLGGEWTYEPEE